MSSSSTSQSSQHYRWLLLFLVCLLSLIGNGRGYLPFRCHDCVCVLSPSSTLEVDCRRLGLTEIPGFLRQSNYSSAIKMSLYLDHNNITVIRTGDLATLKNLTRLTMTDNDLSYIEDNAFYDQTFFSSIDLSFNSLTVDSFADNSFAAPNNTGRIAKLEITHNLLSAPPRALAKRRFITFLTLSNNPMGLLRSGAFKGYSSEIQELKLSGCNLRSLEPNVFDFNTFPLLKILFLNDNNFGEINSMFLAGAHISDKLHLQNSGIHQIRNRTFSNRRLRSLKFLYLDDNDLSRQASRNCFSKLDLKVISLTNCSLTRIKKGFLRMKASSVYLAYNHIRKLTNSTFNGLEEVSVLQISDNHLNEIEGQPFQKLQKLSNLYLSNNQIGDTNLNFLGQLDKLRSLDISDNRMSEFPDVSHIPLLTYVYADHNRLKAVRKDTFVSNRHLTELHLNDNRGLEQIARGAFRRQNRIRAVDLSFSGLRRLPNLETFPELYDFRLEHSRLTELPANICQIAPKLKFLYAYDNELEAIPDLSNCTALIHLELQYNRIREISEHSFKGLESLETVRLYRNRIQSCHPNALRGLSFLEEFDLSHNQLDYLPPDLFRGLINLRRLELQYNKIINLPRNIFRDLKHLELLFANDNSIRTVGSVIFHPNMSWLHNLSLSNNPEMPRLPLPLHGFPFLGSLEMANLPLIYDVPTVMDIPRIQTIEFTYSYHCCLFKDYAPPGRLALQASKDTGDPEILFTFKNTPAEEITIPPDISDSLLFQGIDPFNHKIQGISPQEFIDGLLEYQKLYNVTLIPYENGEVVAIANRDKSVVGRLKDEESKYLRSILPSFFVSREVYCTPLPSSLTPCDNLLDPQPLPVLVWIIWFTAVIANLAVLFVMIVSKEKLEVHHFFICNLAFADFLLGVYLAFLGAVDIRTRGKGFYKSALTWQTGPGCQTAGFIAIFASELSVFILTIMTLERLQTIAYSFKSGRLKLRNAAIIVLVCWVMAGVLASLPIFGVNSYSEVAICLPFKLSSVRDKLFIALIPTLNLTAFFIILASYLHILRLFCRSPANTGDNGNKREKIVVSFKMGVLVLTNLACWLPLATVGYAAVADQHIIDFVEAKFFIILIFPINACLNPFIYSIFTKQFLSRARGLCHRKDKMQHVSNNHSFYRLSFRRNSIASAASDTCSSTLRTNSPRCDIDFDLLTRRQSRRSFSVQLASPPLAQPVVSVVSPGPHMGRRYSSPAIFANMDSSSLSPPSLPPQVPGNEGRAAGLPELPRPHSKCLSIVQEESDESDSEEVGAVLSANLRSRRRSSDPEVLSSSRVGGLKDLFGPRGDKVEDERTSPCAFPSYKSDSPPHRSSSPPLVNPGTVQSHGGASPPRVPHVHSSDLVVRRLSPLTAHSIRIVNPHATKVSKHCIQESQV